MYGENKQKEFIVRTGVKILGELGKFGLMYPVLGNTAFGLLEKVVPIDHWKQKFKGLQEWAVVENHPIGQFVKRIFTDLNPKACKTIENNFFTNATSIGASIIRNRRNKGIYFPPNILISPTMRCNLKCIGCYAKNYSKSEELSIETLDDIFSQGKKGGCFIYWWLGGEPLLRKKDLLYICKKHSDTYNFVFTNGTLLDKETISDFANLGNVAFFLSVEGLEKETDLRRGKGVFNKLMGVMDDIRQNGLFFGVSVTATSKNINTVISDDFIQMLTDKGVFMAWYFLYVPLDRDADLSLMPSPHQRNFLRLKIQEMRQKHPVLLVDFWGDAPYVEGCIAARTILHIDHKGRFMPCIFAPFYNHTIYKKSIEEAYNSKLFQEIRKRQPYSKNFLKPCMMLDNPHVIREVCKECGAIPAHGGAENFITNLAPDIDRYALEVAKQYNPLFEEATGTRQRIEKAGVNIFQGFGIT